jgi:UDP-glucuronate decarboxylase
VPADFARAVLQSKNIEIYSDGTPTRTFCYVADAMIGYLQALTYGQFDYFNIGIERPELTIGDLAKVFQTAGAESMNYQGSIIYKTSLEKNYLIDNPSRRCPDITKARQLLNFSPKIEVYEGVRRYLRFLIESGEES